MWDLIVLVPDHCLSFYFAGNKLSGFRQLPTLNKETRFAFTFVKLGSAQRCRRMVQGQKYGILLGKG